MSHNRYPPGWDEERVSKVLDHYENQSDEEAVAEDEESFDRVNHTVMEIPREFLTAVRNLIARKA